MARLNVDTIALPLSIASYTLCTVLWLRWAYAPGRTTMLLVALGTASLGLSGQGYMQLMFLLSLIPIFVFAKRRMPTSQIVRTVAVVGAVTVLLMLPFFVSYLLNGHLMYKHGNLDLDTVQPFEYFVMNLVVDQREFFESSLLTKQPFVYLYSNYVGHVTVILATIAVYARFLRGDVTPPVTAPAHQDSPKHESQSVLLWVGLITISALLVSGGLQRALLWLDVTLLSEFVAYLRNVIIVGCVIAIAAIFLSGYGLRIVLAHLGQIRGNTPMRRTVNVVSMQIVLCLILGWQALKVRDYAQSFVAFDERDTNVAAAMEYLDDYPLGYVMSESNYQYLYILDSTHKNVWNLFYPFQYKNAVNLEAAYRIASTPIEPNEGWRELSRFGDLH
ncbi:MAG: hypothetical protein FJ040_10900, partial [Chloroflexi bacterium]|nr:hypothetical protein [Chloroflexota bacterium]